MLEMYERFENGTVALPGMTLVVVRVAHLMCRYINSCRMHSHIYEGLWMNAMR
jgi:hypothetical protein